MLTLSGNFKETLFHNIFKACLSMIGQRSTDEKIASVAILTYVLSWLTELSTTLVVDPDLPALKTGETE